jgi:hypothetical protein
MKTDFCGNIRWYNNDGELHRIGSLPTIEYSGGYKAWYIYNKYYVRKQIINIYKILKGFSRYCFRKIRMRKLSRLRYIHDELLCMPAKGSCPGGEDYHKMVSYFMSV